MKSRAGLGVLIEERVQVHVEQPRRRAELRDDVRGRDRVHSPDEHAHGAGSVKREEFWDAIADCEVEILMFVDQRERLIGALELHVDVEGVLRLASRLLQLGEGLEELRALLVHPCATRRVHLGLHRVDDRRDVVDRRGPLPEKPHQRVGVGVEEVEQHLRVRLGRERRIPDRKERDDDAVLVDPAEHVRPLVPQFRLIA
mmetsp:Transcript_27011/g.64451  ORF Transcript_27011/g.64451 Transcript_27011/m.64451 type:complete len:200 (-) Transcript_27011:158-757(-)